MNKKGPIIYVEDDPDDKALFCDAIKELGMSNEVIAFTNGKEAFDGINEKNIDPFIIISDINMPKMSGIELRDKMQTFGELRLRTVPFIFFTSGAPADNVLSAYADSVQGFFIKPDHYDKIAQTVRKIFEYWVECKEPVFK